MIMWGRKTWAVMAMIGLVTCAPLRGEVDAPSPSRPSVVLIMADDMGFADLGCYGSEINTPNLSALANSGVRYTNFYNTSSASTWPTPTKAAPPRR